MKLTDAMEQLLTALHDEFSGDDEPPRIVAQPGTTTTADWCSGDVCWQIYLRLDAAFPSQRFPTADGGPFSQTVMAARWHAGVFRCITGMDDDGTPPDPLEQTVDTAQLLDDAHRIMCALLAARFRRGDRMLGTWTPVGPFGNCAGGYWPFTVRL